MCSKQSKKACIELFGDEALFVPYTDPGYVLFKKVLTEIAGFKVKKGYPPKMIFLENHGIFVAANSIDEIISIYEMIMQKLDSRIQVDLPSDLQEPILSVLIDKVKELNPRFCRFIRRWHKQCVDQPFCEGPEQFQQSRYIIIAR